MDVDVEREPGPLIAGGSAFQHLAHVFGARETKQAGPAVERLGQLRLGQPLVTLQPQDHARVDAPRPRGHDQAFERGEPHCCVYRPTPDDRRQRGARTEVTRDHPEAGQRHGEQLTRAAPRIGVREPVEAVALDGMAAAPLFRDRVRCRGSRNRRMKRGIEAGGRRHARKELADRHDRGDRGGHVKRREVRDRVKVGDQLRVNASRRRVARPSVDDSVTDSVYAFHLQHSRLQVGALEAALRGVQLVVRELLVVRTDQAHLERARARVDDEDAHRLTRPRG